MSSFEVVCWKALFAGIRLLARATCFYALCVPAMIATIDLGYATLMDMGGQIETHLSGRMIDMQLGYPYMIIGPLYDFPLGLLLGFFWALGLEAVYTYADPKRLWVQPLLFCLTATMLMYVGLSEFAACNIGEFVRQGALSGHPVVLQVIAGPVFRGLLRGIGPSFVFWYSALWGVPLGLLLWLSWRFVLRKRIFGGRHGTHTKATGAQELASAALETRE
ncbi:MAG: hypothetical protein RBU21_09055 [FCB group bacterium]|jgi:hypothetical protein|nr:hypothetical protein [FCB group bacterium]